MFLAVNTQKGGVPSLVDSCDTVSEEEKQLSSIDSTIRYKLKTINETASTPLTTFLDCFFFVALNSLKSSRYGKSMT